MTALDIARSNNNRAIVHMLGEKQGKNSEGRSTVDDVNRITYQFQFLIFQIVDSFPSL